MYFTKIRLNGASDVDLPLIGATPSDNYIMKGADGLGPVDVVVTILNGVYQGKQPSDRQIVLRVGLNSNYGANITPEQLRATLYEQIGLRGDIPLHVELMNGSVVVATTDGYISKIEPVIFAKDPEVQITIDCIGSYLYDPVETSIVPTLKTAFPIPYTGNAPMGFMISFRFTGSLSSFKLTRTSDSTDFIDITYPFIPNDLLVIDTREGFRDVVVLSGFTATNLIGYVKTGVEWPKLYPGINTFNTSSQLFNWEYVNFTQQYWGI